MMLAVHDRPYAWSAVSDMPAIPVGVYHFQAALPLVTMGATSNFSTPNDIDDAGGTIETIDSEGMIDEDGTIDSVDCGTMECVFRMATKRCSVGRVYRAMKGEMALIRIIFWVFMCSLLTRMNLSSLNPRQPHQLVSPRQAACPPQKLI
jgi:hypothetical protein